MGGQLPTNCQFRSGNHLWAIPLSVLPMYRAHPQRNPVPHYTHALRADEMYHCRREQGWAHRQIGRSHQWQDAYFYAPGLREQNDFNCWSFA